MPIVGNENYNPAMFLEEVPAAPSEVFGASAEQAMLDNPAQRIATEYQFYQSEKKAREEKQKMIPREEAQGRATNMGLQINNLPDQISEDGFKILSDRQYQRKIMDISSSSGDSITAKLVGGLIGSLADPINVASSFIPVPGINGMTSALAKAGTNLFTKAYLRAGIGLVEGAAGGALLEAANIPLANKLGDEYGVSDSAFNILTGAIGGALLHPAFGLAKDVLDPRLAHVTDMSPEAKGNYSQAVMAQALDDRPISKDLIDVARAKELSQSYSNIELERNKALAVGDEESIRFLDNQKKIIQNEMQEDVFKTLSKLSDRDIENIQKRVDGGKGDRYLSPKELEAQDVELQESPYNDIESNLDTISQEEVLTLQENAKQMEVSVDKELELADQHVREVKEFSDNVKAFAKCITRGK